MFQNLKLKARTNLYALAIKINPDIFLRTSEGYVVLIDDETYNVRFFDPETKAFVNVND